MDKDIVRKLQLSRNLKLFGILVFACQIAIAQPTGKHNQTSEILVKRVTNSTGELVSKIYKLNRDGQQEEIQQPFYTLKSDIFNVQSDSKTVNVNTVDALRNKKHVNKSEIVHENFKRGTIPDVSREEPVKRVSLKTNDSEEKGKKHEIREDVKNRSFSVDESLENLESSSQEAKHHHPSKRSEDDYYTDEPETETSFKRMTTPPSKEEDSFFNIFESLFGSSDDETQTKKKTQSEEDIFKFDDSEDADMKENIKTVGDILKPLKPAEESEYKSKNSYLTYQNNVPEYRIVNNFNVRQSEKQGQQYPNRQSSYHSSYRPITEPPFQPHKTHSTSGYEDYDLDEFLDKTDSETHVKYSPPAMASDKKESIGTMPDTNATPHGINGTAPTVSSSSWSTVKSTTENKVKFPNYQKNKDYYSKNRYQEPKIESSEKPLEKETEKTSFQKSETKITTEKPHGPTYSSNYHHVSKVSDIQSHKVQENPNFYNLINLPVKYSTKDTAIPLISTSYANTKIQGMGAHKYEKGNNGKYPNHKYDQANLVTTQKPSYWATKRTESTVKFTDKFSNANNDDKTSLNHISQKDIDKMEYDPWQIGMGPEFGGYGSKKGTEVKTSTQLPKVTTTEEPISHNDEKNKEKESHVMKVATDQKKSANKEDSLKFTTDDYDYDIIPARVDEFQPSSQNNPQQGSYINSEHQNEVEFNKNLKTGNKDTYLPVPDSELPEYEYYDYDFDMSTTTTAVTTTKTIPSSTTVTTPVQEIKNKRPNPPKDAMESESVSEKVAVVIATKDDSLYTESKRGSSKPPAIVLSSAETTAVSPNTFKTTITPSTTTITSTTTTTTTTTSTTTPKPTQTTFLVTKPYNNQGVLHFNPHFGELHKSKLSLKESLPSLDREKLAQKHTSVTQSIPTKNVYTIQSNRTESTVYPNIGTSSSTQKQGEQKNNSNIILVPGRLDVKATEKVQNYTKKESHTSNAPNNHFFQTSYTNNNGLKYSNYPGFHSHPSYTSRTGYTTEFTLGAAVHGHNGGGASQVGVKPNFQSQLAPSPVVPNSYGNDQPFKPIPKPTGITSSFQVVRDDGFAQHLPNKNPALFHNKHNKHPISLSATSGDRIREPSHKPQDFIPSPQFHRPTGPKIVGDVRPPDIDYELDGIQTEPKPGQYVMFSKPQLNPELNENQVKKNSEVGSVKPSPSNGPLFHDSANVFSPENQEHVIFNPKEGQFYYSETSKKPVLSEKPIHLGLTPTSESGLSLQLTPPKGIQTEKPFDRNFITPDSDKKSTVSYPRPHWEKNGKPSFFFNPMQNKNDMNRPQASTNQMPHTMMPHNGPPQRLRRPMQPPNIMPSRKNFNEASASVKPKPNLPNILPQFRPNTKIGSGPYHRPTASGNPNRRNGINRFYENEHGNFPYHIQYPEKESFPLRDYEVGPEIVPKFITNRGKLPSELWNSGMQKRFGQGLPNPQSLSLGTYNSPQNVKILKRLQRTPVTTLQMLKQMPGVKTQKMPIKREDIVASADASALIPPAYQTFTENPNTEERLYVVYPAKPPQKFAPYNDRVFIVSDNGENTEKLENQKPVLNPTKRGNYTNEKTKNVFPYDFVKLQEQMTKNKNTQFKTVDSNGKDDNKVHEEAIRKKAPEPVQEKHETIDMNLHMQSNNQWNEIRTTSVPRDSNFFSNFDGKHRSKEKEPIENEQTAQSNPPSEYRVSIGEDGKGSAFTLGTIMHASSDANKMGQVASVPLHPGLSQLTANERISNGKIITVSVPPDAKETQEIETVPESQSFQAPFQASSSIDNSGSFSPNQGWSVVKRPENNVEKERETETTEPSTTRFNFENFKPELLGGFKPIFEHIENPEEQKPFEQQIEKKTERDEKVLMER